MGLPTTKRPEKECGKTETTVKDELLKIARLAKAARMAKVNAEIRKDAYLEDITECVVRAMSKMQECDDAANKLRKIIEVGEHALANPYQLTNLGLGQQYIQEIVDCAKATREDCQ